MWWLQKNKKIEEAQSIDIFHLKKKISELESIVKEICPHKHLIEKDSQAWDLLRGIWVPCIVFECELCKEALVRRPKDSKIKTTKVVYV
jgi:hypothetical protein